MLHPHRSSLNFKEPCHIEAANAHRHGRRPVVISRMRNQGVSHQNVTEPTHATKFIPCLRPSFHPFHARVRVPKTPPKCPVRPFPVNQSWPMPTCDAMRVRDARCACPPFPSTPRYASCCALTPARGGPEDSSRPETTACHGTQKTISLWGRPLPRSKHFVPPTPSQGMSTRGGCRWSASPVTLGAAVRPSARHEAALEKAP